MAKVIYKSFESLCPDCNTYDCTSCSPNKKVDYTNITPVQIWGEFGDYLGVADCIVNKNGEKFYAERFYGWQEVKLICKVSKVTKSKRYN